MERGGVSFDQSTECLEGLSDLLKSHLSQQVWTYAEAN